MSPSTAEAQCTLVTMHLMENGFAEPGESVSVPFVPNLIGDPRPEGSAAASTFAVTFAVTFCTPGKQAFFPPWLVFVVLRTMPPSSSP